MQSKPQSPNNSRSCCSAPATATGWAAALGAALVVLTACGPDNQTKLDYSVTSIEGDLGDLGAVKPIVSSLFISNSGETLIYLSTVSLSCNGLTISRWLGQTLADAQIIEVVIKGDPQVKKYNVPPNEVNYAKGGRSSSYEVTADSGNVNFVTFKPSELVEGDLEAHYGGQQIKGTFHATYCDGGQGF